MSPRQKRLVQVEDLYRFQLLNQVRLSPDGRHAVYTLQRVDQKTEKKYSSLWIVSTEAGAPRQFTYGDQNDHSPCWSPDSKQIAFLSNRQGKGKPSQIYLLPFDGGEARPLTDIQGEIGDFAWSPDGKRFICQVRKTDAEALEREKDEQKKELGVVSRHYQRVFYKLDGYGYLPQERWHLWSVDARSGKARQLTDHAIFDEQGPAWSPDGKWIAFTSNRSEDPDFKIDYVDVFIMPAAGGELRRIPAPIGDKNLPSFSPDGKWIAYYGSEGEGEGYRNQGLWLAPVDGSAAARNLTAPYDIHVSSGTINDLGQPEMMRPTWAKDSQRIYFQVSIHGCTTLNSIDLSGKDLQTVIGEDGVVGSFTLNATQQRLAYFYGCINDPCQVYVREMSSGGARQLTQHNQELLTSLDLGQIESVWFKGPDGNDLQGWILKPPQFDPQQKYPSIMEIHGGPMTQYGNFFMHEFYFLAAQGYVVYFTNPRGGRGYGEAHTKAIWGGWGGADYADLSAWADYMAAQPYIDTARMGVTGGSYGGYMTLWVIGHTDRFAAAVAQRCVSNLISLWGSSDFNWTFQQELRAGPPTKDFQKYWDLSPVKYLGASRTPTLIIHNENDLRCPIEQGEQAFVALKSAGVESEMVRFPDEFHGLSRTGRTDRRIARLNHIARWFNKYLR